MCTGVCLFSYLEGWVYKVFIFNFMFIMALRLWQGDLLGSIFGEGGVALVGSVSNVHKAVKKTAKSALGPLSVMGFASTCTVLVHHAAAISDGGVIIKHSTHVSNRVMGGIIYNALVNVNFSIIGVKLTSAPAARITIAVRNTYNNVVVATSRGPQV